jgi:hypothetical protein
VTPAGPPGKAEAGGGAGAGARTGEARRENPGHAAVAPEGGCWHPCEMAVNFRVLESCDIGVRWWVAVGGGRRGEQDAAVWGGGGGGQGGRLPGSVVRSARAVGAPRPIPRPACHPIRVRVRVSSQADPMLRMPAGRVTVVAGGRGRGAESPVHRYHLTVAAPAAVPGWRGGGLPRLACMPP